MLKITKKNFYNVKLFVFLNIFFERDDGKVNLNMGKWAINYLISSDIYTIYKMLG